jgi:hypothetical protein
VYDVDDVAELSGCLRERAHRVAGRDVHGMRAHGVTGCFQRLRGRGERVRVEVGEQDGPARALPAGNGLADTSGADHDDYLGVHLHAPAWWGWSLLNPASPDNGWCGRPPCSGV